MCFLLVPTFKVKKKENICPEAFEQYLPLANFLSTLTDSLTLSCLYGRCAVVPPALPLSLQPVHRLHDEDQRNECAE